MAASSASMDKSLKDIASTSQHLVQAQRRANTYLDSIDLGIRNLEQSAVETNALLAKSNDISEQNLLQSRLAREREEWRDQRNELRLKLEKEEKEVEQSIKNMLHHFDRRVQLLPEAGMTNLEIYFFAQQMLDTVKEISPDILKDISDKKYRDQVEDTLRSTIDGVKASFSDQDSADLSSIVDIERVDENAQSIEFLDAIEKSLSVIDEVAAMKKKLSRYKSLSSADLKDIKSKMAKISEAIGGIA
jgi:hypothetical protein